MLRREKEDDFEEFGELNVKGEETDGGGVEVI